MTSGLKLGFSENPIPENFDDFLVSFLVLKFSIIRLYQRPKRKFLYRKLALGQAITNFLPVTKYPHIITQNLRLSNFGVGE